MPQRWIKDPDAVLDYTVDWEDWLNGDTIKTSVWALSSGITEDSDSKTTLTATIWLSGGTVGNKYTVINEIVTNGGRTENRSIYIEVKER